MLYVQCLMLHSLDGHADFPTLQVMTALSVAKEALQRKAVSAQPKALAQTAMEQGQAIFTIPEVRSNPVQGDALQLTWSDKISSSRGSSCRQAQQCRGVALRLYVFGILLLHSSSKGLMLHAVC